MARPIGRRAFLAKSTLVAAAGTAAAVATTSSAEAAPATRRGPAELATVDRHDGELAEVTVRGSGKAEMLPLTGFVPGWRLRPGDQVVVTNEKGTRFVEPLLSFVVGQAGRTPSHTQAATEIAGKTFVLRDATTIEAGDSSTAYMVHYISNNREPDVWATSVRPSA